MTERRMDPRLVAALAVLGGLAALILLTWFGVPPFDNLQVFLAVQSASFVTLVMLGVLGGAFLGMVLAHRMAANRDFTPFERTMLETLTEVREATRRLEAVETDLVERLDRLEKEFAKR